MNVSLEYGQIKGERMTREEEIVNELLNPEHVNLFKEDALRLARKVYLTQDWNDEKWTTNLKVMAKNLIPKKWYKKEF